jgi:hypothetical protein
MDLVIEEALKSIIERLNKLEARQSSQKNQQMATKAQLDYIVRLGGEKYETLTKQEASIIITSLQKKQKEKENSEEMYDGDPYY